MGDAHHRGQLRVCHQVISADVRVHEVSGDEATQYCELRDVVWCWDCDYYVCPMHALTRHWGHTLGPRND